MRQLPKKTWGVANDCTFFRPPSVPRVQSDVIIGVVLYPRLRKEGEKRTVVCSTLGVAGAMVHVRAMGTWPSFLLLPGLGTRLYYTDIISTQA